MKKEKTGPVARIEARQIFSERKLKGPWCRQPPPCTYYVGGSLAGFKMYTSLNLLTVSVYCRLEAECQWISRAIISLTHPFGTGLL